METTVVSETVEVGGKGAEYVGDVVPANPTSDDQPWQAKPLLSHQRWTKTEDDLLTQAVNTYQVSLLV